MLGAVVLKYVDNIFLQETLIRGQTNKIDLLALLNINTNAKIASSHLRSVESFNKQVNLFNEGKRLNF
jgi:hypothetical protein